MKMRMSLKTALLCSVLLAALLVGCSYETLPPEDTAEPLPSSYAEVCTVRFQAEGLTFSEQRIAPGESPTVPEVRLDGYVFSHWVSEKGNRTSPEKEAVFSDRVFTAVMYPDLSKNAPYLFADENGFLHPEGLLTGQALDRALRALAARETALADIPIDTEADSLTAEDLQAVLEKCFHPGNVAGFLAEFGEGSAVTRNGFARVMNALLDRKKTVRITQAQTLPRDVALEADMEDILNAALVWEYDPGGYPIYGVVVWQMPWQPGFTILDGWLYYADENGKVLTNGSLGKLTFDGDGRYTTGDEELDRLVARRIADLIAADPAADRQALLYAAFEYARGSFDYVNRGVLRAGAAGWEAEKAKQMFDMGSGNCYNYAAAFWALARGLGYEAVCYSGNALTDQGPHAWVQIEMEGQPYIFDPQLARRGEDGERNNFNEDMFCVPKDIWYKWRYDHP